METKANKTILEPGKYFNKKHWLSQVKPIKKNLKTILVLGQT
jgi:predicted DNA-binding protein (MmcQ/YjbR family)